MTCNNFSTQLDDQSYWKKKQFASVYFENKPEKLPELDWQKKKFKHKYITLTKKDCNNTATWQIDRQENLLIEIDKNGDRVLTIILDMQSISIKYLNQVNNANK